MTLKRVASTLPFVTNYFLKFIEDIVTARIHLGRIEQQLDEVTDLFGWNPLDIGVQWGDLTEQEQAKIRERDSVE